MTFNSDFEKEHISLNEFFENLICCQSVISVKIIPFFFRTENDELNGKVFTFNFPDIYAELKEYYTHHTTKEFVEKSGINLNDYVMWFRMDVDDNRKIVVTVAVDVK